MVSAPSALPLRGPARPFQEIPQPAPHRLLGHFPDWLGMEQGKRVLQRLERYAEECGPLARVQLGPTSIVTVNDVDLVARLLSDPDANYKGWTYILTRAVLHNVLLLNGHAWSEGRRLYRQALADVDIVASAEQSAARWTEDYPLSWESRPVELAAVSHRLVGDTIADLLIGVPLEPALEPDRIRIQYELAAVGMDLQCQPWAYLRPSRWLALRASVRRFRDHFSTVVRERQDVSPPVRADVLARLLVFARQGQHGTDPVDIADTLINIYFTAHDVLASSTAWCLWLLARHRDVQSRLRDELRSARSSAAPCDVAYLGQVVKESLRLYPGYALFGRNPQRRLVLGGYEIPRSALVIVSPYVIHRLSRYWPRPEQFDPERWRDDPNTLPAPRPDRGYFPFGAGHRSCLASRLAFPAMKLLVARVVQHGQLTARPGHVPRLAYCGTGYSENGLWASLQVAARDT